MDPHAALQSEQDFHLTSHVNPRITQHILGHVQIFKTHHLRDSAASLLKRSEAE